MNGSRYHVSPINAQRLRQDEIRKRPSNHQMASQSPTWRLPSNPLFQPNLPRGKRHDEELINAYEAEEERITNVLCRKLEQLREEKIALENTLEAENESHVNRLTRQIAQLQTQLSASTSSSSANGRRIHTEPEPPQPTMFIEAMRLENAQLRNRVADLERDFLRVSRVNDVYRQELLEHRRKLGLPYESLIGLAASASQSVSSSPVDTFSSQPHHRRIPASIPPRSGTASTNAGPTAGPSNMTGTSAVPIPRVQSQTRIHPETLSLTAPPSSDSTPPSSPSYSLSPTAPLTHMHSSFFPGPSSYLTTLTTPASMNPLPTPLAHQTPLSPPSTSTSNGLARALTELASAHAQRAGLSYPSVPPPSLASSLGSGSPVVPTLRVPPNSRRQSESARVAETGSLRPSASSSNPGSSSAVVVGVGVGSRRRMSTSRTGEDELEEIGEAYSDEEVLDEEDDELDGAEGYRASGGLEIGRGRGRGRGGGGVMGLGLTGTR